MLPPGVTVPDTPDYTCQHPDLIIAENDLIGDCDNNQELYNLCAERGITHIFFIGVATNKCILVRSSGMIPMTELGLETILVRDLTEGMTGNGYDCDEGEIDGSLSPDMGTRLSIEWVERWVGGSIDANQLLVHNPAYRYTTRVQNEPGLLLHLRLDAKDGYRHTQDTTETQGAWHTVSVAMGHPGALAGDSDTAAWFDGTGAFDGVKNASACSERKVMVPFCVSICSSKPGVLPVTTGIGIPVGGPKILPLFGVKKAQQVQRRSIQSHLSDARQPP